MGENPRRQRLKPILNSEPAIQNLLGFSWVKTKEILFPFQFKRWLKILVIVWLAGHAGGFNFNFRLPQKLKTVQERFEKEQGKPKDQATQKSAASQETPNDTGNIPQGYLARLVPQYNLLGLPLPDSSPPANFP